jgi:TonB family protein
MFGRRFLSATLLVAVLLIPAASKLRAASPADHPPADAQSNKEFQGQVAEIIQSYRKHDPAKGKQLIEQFRLPNAQDWFAAHLNSARSADLASRYDRLYMSFAESFELTVQDIVAAKGADLGAEVKTADEKPAEDSLFGGKRSGVVTINPVDLFFCMFQITVKKAPNVSWGSTFVQQDGVFRFIGFGGWPFWVWQDHTEGGAVKASHFGTPPILISKADPVYPLQARATKIQGTVVLRVRIDKEGRVNKVEVISGDPKLTQAAVDAVRQWRYKPATLGGAVIVMEETTNVVFQLH